MASWVRGTDASVAAGVFDGEQIESPRADEDEDALTAKEAIDAVMLYRFDRGDNAEFLAKTFRVSLSTVYNGIERARLRRESRTPIGPDPEVAILFPVNEFTPTSECKHPKPIPAGRHEYCPSCDETGIEGHPALRRRPGDQAMPAAGAKSYVPSDGLAGGTGK